MTDRPIRFTILLVLLLTGLLSGSSSASGTSRIKDIAHMRGVRANQLYGYGLVVGLSGTGDKRQTLFTVQSLTNLLERMGVAVDPSKMRVQNVAAVMVTASLPPFARAGQPIDVAVSSIGDAESLQGGTLIVTPLRGLDGQVYAMAQGSVVLGGFSAGGTGARVGTNHPTAGRIPNGATVEREIPFSLQGSKTLVYTLEFGDFTSASHLAQAINTNMKQDLAKALDSRTIQVTIPDTFKADPVAFISQIENLPVETDQPAKVIVNEKTGTVVMGQEVKISAVAVMHGNLSVAVTTELNVSQPAPFSQGQTTTTPQSNVSTQEEKTRNVILGENTTVEELVQALNKIGATPRDVVAILMAIQAAGALKATIEVI